MRNFVLGIAVTVVVLLLALLGVATLGLLPTRANRPPLALESQIAMSALDNSVDRHAPRVNSPVPPTDENLIEGIKIYTMNCALCHGGIDRQPSTLEHSFYPAPPNFMFHPPDDPDWHVYFVIRNGIRYTGMPAWDKTLSEPDMWKVTTFLTRMEKLPPAVQDYWKKSTGTNPPVADPEAHDHK